MGIIGYNEINVFLVPGRIIGKDDQKILNRMLKDPECLKVIGQCANNFESYKIHPMKVNQSCSYLSSFVSFGGRKEKYKVYLFEAISNKKTGPRTLQNMKIEFMQQFMENMKDTILPIISRIILELNVENPSQSPNQMGVQNSMGLLYGRETVLGRIGEEVMNSIPPQNQFFNQYFKEAASAIESSNILERFRKQQAYKIRCDMKQLTKLAFANGLSLEDVTGIINEMAIKDVLEK